VFIYAKASFSPIKTNRQTKRTPLLYVAFIFVPHQVVFWSKKRQLSELYPKLHTPHSRFVPAAPDEAKKFLMSL